MIKLPDTHEVKTALAVVSRVVANDDVPGALIFLIQMATRDTSAKYHLAARSALFDDVAKANALRLLGRLEAYEELTTFINNQRT